MNNSMIMCSFQSHGHLNGNTCGFLDGKLPFLGNILLKSDSLDQFHNDIINPAIIPYIKYIDNIRMCKTCCCLCFATEFTDKRCILSEFRF